MKREALHEASSEFAAWCPTDARGSEDTLLHLLSISSRLPSRHSTFQWNQDPRQPPLLSPAFSHIPEESLEAGSPTHTTNLNPSPNTNNFIVIAKKHVNDTTYALIQIKNHEKRRNKLWKHFNQINEPG